MTGIEIQNVLVTLPFTDEHFERVKTAFAPANVLRVDSTAHEAITAALTSVDVAIVEQDIDARYVKAPKLKWVHCGHAGLEVSAMPEVFETGLVVTGSAGRSGAALAQHAFFFALSLTFDSPRLLDQQRNGEWQAAEGYDQRLALWGKTLLVVGLGHTGIEVAALGKAFGMRVLAYRREMAPAPPQVDVVYSYVGGDSLDEPLRQCDVLVLATRLTDETYHMIGARELALMKPTAYVVNMSRGSVIDEVALVEALNTGDVAGAGLDVFEQEPLPKDAPIRSAVNTIITTHQTPRMPDKAERVVELIVANAARFKAGEPLLNAMKPSDVYTRRN